MSDQVNKTDAHDLYRRFVRLMIEAEKQHSDMKNASVLSLTKFLAEISDPVAFSRISDQIRLGESRLSEESVNATPSISPSLVAPSPLPCPISVHCPSPTTGNPLEQEQDRFIQGLSYLKETVGQARVVHRKVPITAAFVESKLAKNEITPAQATQLYRTKKIHAVLPNFDARSDEDGYLLPSKLRSEQSTAMCAAIRTRYSDLEGTVWSKIKVEEGLLYSLLLKCKGEVRNTFCASFDEGVGSHWNKTIRTIFTYDWMASMATGGLTYLSSGLPDEARSDYKFVYDRFTQFLKNKVDQLHKGGRKPTSLNDASTPKIKSKRVSRKRRKHDQRLVTASFDANMRQHYGALAVISIGGMSDEETDDEETNIRGQRVLGVRRLAFRSDAYTNASHYLDAVAHSHLHSRTFHPYSRPGPTPRKPRVQKTTVGRSDPPMWSPPEFYSDTFIKQATDSNMLKVLNRGASIPNPLPTIEDYNRWAMEGDISLAEAWNAHKSDCVTCGRDMDMS